MVPKVIHYCWFGGKPLPELAVQCINSWKKYLPEYEIKEWNESNFDVNCINYTKEAYQAKKYAFVSDYARFWILYRYGGLYFDTDVEVIKPLDDIINKGPFMGCENLYIENSQPECLGVNAGLGIGAVPKIKLYKELLDNYESLHFYKDDGTLNLKTVVDYTTELLCQYGLKNTPEIQKCAEIWIYPKDYFCPKDYKSRKINITRNTVCIHHFDGSWQKKSDKFKNFMIRLLGPILTNLCVKFKQKVNTLLSKL